LSDQVHAHPADTNEDVLVLIEGKSERVTTNPSENFTVLEIWSRESEDPTLTVAAVDTT
jgi:hypothetical protein